MLTALISTATAALFGSADFLGGLASRKSPALLVSAVMFATGVLIFPLVLLVVPPEAVGLARRWLWRSLRRHGHGGRACRCMLRSLSVA